MSAQDGVRLTCEQCHFELGYGDVMYSDEWGRILCRECAEAYASQAKNDTKESK